jgi:hypothetical protein
LLTILYGWQQNGSRPKAFTLIVLLIEENLQWLIYQCRQKMSTWKPITKLT